jgi:hypothetical protein
MEAANNPDLLQARLLELRSEHRRLDETISRLTASPPDDELQMRRLKKRKLLVKDEIFAIERALDPGPDEYA